MTELERKQDRAPVPASWDYAPAPEARDLVQLRDRYGLFVGGEWLEPKETYATIDPSSEERLAEVGQAGAEEVDRAVGAAREAFDDGWSEIAPAERAKYLYRIARILQERSREFAVLESLNGGKPIRESRDVDLPLSAAHFFYYAGWADKLEYAFPNRKPRPVGVAGQIVPWNFPLLMLAWKIAPALATGNTVVLKPAETTPLSALLFADVLRQAELPPGVVNIVTGDGRTGAALVKHEGVDKIAFTGSTEVGKAIQRELAGTGKKLTLELGGKAANVIFDDAALDQAVEGIVNGIYFNQGHVCCAGSRLLVQESIYEPLIGKLKRRLATLRVGDPLDKNTDVGAWRRARRRAPRSTSRPVACPRRATGSCPPSSRTSRRATGSRRRRSSGRSCRCSRSARRTRRSRRRTTLHMGSPRASGRRRGRGFSRWPRSSAPV
jgi:aldehyde dehydrogenase (NAD+)